MSINEILLARGHRHSFADEPWVLRAVLPQLTSYERGSVAHKAGNIYNLALYKRHLPTSDLGDWLTEKEANLHRAPKGGT